MPIQAKRIYEEAHPDDGLRVLATNYWPRGISRGRAGTYKRILAPSRALLRAFKDGDIDWPTYELRYRDEMTGEDQREEIAALATLAEQQTVTVMCICPDDQQCHRRLLRELIKQEMESQHEGYARVTLPSSVTSRSGRTGVPRNLGPAAVSHRIPAPLG